MATHCFEITLGHNLLGQIINATFNIYIFQVEFNEQVKHYVYWISRKMIVLKEFCRTEEISRIFILNFGWWLMLLA